MQSDKHVPADNVIAFPMDDLKIFRVQTAARVAECSLLLQRLFPKHDQPTDAEPEHPATPGVNVVDMAAWACDRGDEDLARSIEFDARQRKLRDLRIELFPEMAD